MFFANPFLLIISKFYLLYFSFLFTGRLLLGHISSTRRGRGLLGLERITPSPGRSEAYSPMFAEFVTNEPIPAWGVSPLLNQVRPFDRGRGSAPEGHH